MIEIIQNWVTATISFISTCIIGILLLKTDKWWLLIPLILFMINTMIYLTLIII